MIAICRPSLSASLRSWLTNRIVLPSRLCKSSSSSCRCSRISGSNAENGSSIRRMSESVASARASPTRCCMPPESSCTYLSPQRSRSTSSRCFRTMASRSARPAPRNSRPKLTFSWTVRHGSRANCWNTMAMRSVRMRRRVAASQPAMSSGASPSRTRTSPRVTLQRPFTARSRVDLPEPDRPISTQISPLCTASDAPATPITEPVASWMPCRSAPPSSICRAAGTSPPNRMSTAFSSIA